jgi:hypothetical protein
MKQVKGCPRRYVIRYCGYYFLFFQIHGKKTFPLLPLQSHAILFILFFGGTDWVLNLDLVLPRQAHTHWSQAFNSPCFIYLFIYLFLVEEE